MQFIVEVTASSSLVLYADSREELDKILDKMTNEELMDGCYIDDIRVIEEED